MQLRSVILYIDQELTTDTSPIHCTCMHNGSRGSVRSKRFIMLYHSMSAMNIKTVEEFGLAYNVYRLAIYM